MLYCWCSILRLPPSPLRAAHRHVVDLLYWYKCTNADAKSEAGTDPAAAEARAFIHKYGGALTAPSWAKFWLCVLGVHEWEVLYIHSASVFVLLYTRVGGTIHTFSVSICTFVYPKQVN